MHAQISTHKTQNTGCMQAMASADCSDDENNTIQSGCEPEKNTDKESIPLSLFVLLNNYLANKYIRPCCVFLNIYYSIVSV